jgi:L-gulono-1,4-lactone dehydrogenase
MSSLLCCLRRKPGDKASPADNDDAPDSIVSITDILSRLERDPEDKPAQKKIEDRLQAQPSAVFNALKQEANRVPLPEIQPTVAPLSAPSPASTTDKDWVNSVGEQRCTPLKKVKPETLQGLVDAINDAREKKQRVRAVGSGHAFSDVARTDDAVLVDLVLLNDVDIIDATKLRPHAKDLAPRLLQVQAGVMLRALMLELDQRGLALINMGGYDGQKLGGTLSTGTHGSGITFGPLASQARAIVLVSETGVVYQIEPGGEKGVTDPEKFSGVIQGVPVVLKQDDDWFRAAQVAMGCLGVIYGYIFEVADAFIVKEQRRSTTWEEIKPELMPAKWHPVAPIVAAVDHFELVLNPYTRWFRNACVKIERTRLPNDTPASGQRQDWLEALLQQVAIQKAPDLVAFLSKIPFLSPLVIDQAIMTLVYDEPYIDKSYNVFSLGSANEIKGMALELHCDATQCVPTIDKLLGVFQEQALKYMWYMAGPLGIRFVAASDAFLAPQSGRMTCTIELTMLVGLETGKELAKRVKERICTADTSSVRVHWGLDMDFITAKDVRAWYPEFEKWHEVYKGLNTTGMFSNKFTDRVGISAN